MGPARSCCTRCRTERDDDVTRATHAPYTHALPCAAKKALLIAVAVAVLVAVAAPESVAPAVAAPRRRRRPRRAWAAAGTSERDS